MISRYVCKKQGHKNNEMKHICIKKDCNLASNIGCRQCMIEQHKNHNFDEILEYDEVVFQEKTNIQDLFKTIKDFRENIEQELQFILNLLTSYDYYSQFIQDRSLQNYEILGKRLKNGFISNQVLQDQLNIGLQQIKQVKQTIQSYKIYLISTDELYNSAFEIYKSDLDGALHQVNLALDQDHQYIPALQLKADLLNIKGNYEEAISYSDSILNINENNILARITKAEALQKMKRFPEALQQIQLVLDKQDNNKFALLIKANCQNKQESQITLNKLKQVDDSFYQQNIDNN